MSTHIHWRPATPPPPPGASLSLGMVEALQRRLVDRHQDPSIEGSTFDARDVEWLMGVRDAGGSLTDEATMLIDAITTHDKIELRRE